MHPLLSCPLGGSHPASSDIPAISSVWEPVQFFKKFSVCPHYLRSGADRRDGHRAEWESINSVRVCARACNRGRVKVPAAKKYTFYIINYLDSKGESTL